MLLFLAFVLLNTLFSVQSESNQDSRAMAADNTWNVGLRLYHSIRKNSSSSDQQNVLFSPLLVTLSLGSLSTGAKGTTQQQIHKLLRTSEMKVDKAHELMVELRRSFHRLQNSSYFLHSGSALFIASRAAHRFLQGSGLQVHHSMDFTDKGQVLQTINKWAEKSTDTKVSSMAGDVTGGGAVLADAMHFKGLWDREFERDGLDTRTFLGSHYTKVRMMHRAGIYRHFEDIEKMVQVLEMPLVDNGASIIFLMPLHVQPLSRLESMLTQNQINTWLGKLKEQTVSISLPMLTLRSTFDIQKYLKDLGLTDSVDEKKADFSGITSDEHLHLANYLHAATLELDTQGGTSDIEEDLQKPKLFYADHSFIILVRDNETNSLLLIGAVDSADGDALHDEL
ncbi:serine (or cysteine) peptidase inhibitor, clade H, member 2 isoform X1 [Polypterus senegalus]|nr:serine (or cysteine) peptidase inhibitor, clade H, member 2 isoform X1 [Polypterus senegalus]XP_039603114.1 serine (or cysteine) peptidase inhibitor, clade H, member 2 isoform X1 [Polypterus senegalus]